MSVEAVARYIAADVQCMVGLDGSLFSLSNPGSFQTGVLF